MQGSTQAEDVDSTELPNDGSRSIWGEPVIERQINNEYWEGYTTDKGDRLVVAKYERYNGVWAQTDINQMNITEMHKVARK
jgi:hypothetical protein